LTLNLASKAGIDVPGHRLLDVAGRNVLILDRFDRNGSRRIGYISAITLVSGTDGQYDNGYADVADYLEPLASAPDDDLPELFRRAIFGLLVSNTDNHLRNLGLLRDGSGWHLSPAFDMNPNPEPRFFATSVGSRNHRTDTVADALTWCEMFRLDRAQAIDVLAEVTEAVSGWRTQARLQGINRGELAMMAAAFESERTAQAREILASH
jgi:serine/threonine-protein kinase HipA